MTADDLAADIQQWQDDRWGIECPDQPARSAVDLAQHLTAAGWVPGDRIDAGMVVLNHWRGAMLDLSKKYREYSFDAAAHALSCVDAGLHGSDDVGIPRTHDDWQKYLEARRGG